MDSIQYITASDKLVGYNDERLKNSTGKFREFFAKNNEKPTAAYCKLGKPFTCDDDLSKIKGKEGETLNSKKDRAKHIRDFYGNLYKKRIDRLLSIEDFLTQELTGNAEIRNKKLTEEEKNELEGNITVDELKKSLDNSNFNSSSGWDGVSYNMIKKYWNDLDLLMEKMANESFKIGQLPETFRIGLIKLIPKKGNNEKIEDWRPITLLSCGYKIISGVIAGRLEKYLKKITGRAQKGFLRHKNINTVTLNILNNISKAWEAEEELGVLCVDFNKAFDSIEHACIASVLKFFNFGENMVGMVNTILRDRTARVKLNKKLLSVQFIDPARNIHSSMPLNSSHNFLIFFRIFVTHFPPTTLNSIYWGI